MRVWLSKIIVCVRVGSSDATGVKLREPGEPFSM